MSIVDIAIIVFVILGFIGGYNKGLIYELLSLFGFIIALVLAFLFKDNLTILLYQRLPFLNLDIIFKGASVLNILVYEMIAFISLLLIGLLVINIIKYVSVFIKALINHFKIISFPFKITGGIVGSVRFLILALIILFGLTFVNKNYINDSVIAKDILYNVSFLKKEIKNKITILDEIYTIKDSIKNDDSDEFNYKTLELLLKNGIIDVDNVKFLRDSKKLDFNGLDILIERYDINDSK